MPLIKPFRDNKGRLKAGTIPGYDVLRDFFETEIGENPYIIKDISKILSTVSINQNEEDEIYGNIYEILFTKHKIVITNMCDDNAPGLEMEFATFKEEFNTWLLFVKK